MSNRTLTLVVLLGSLRQGAYNGIIADTLPEVAPSDVTIRRLPSIREVPLYDEDDQTQNGIPAVITEMADAIRQADGLVIVTPEYNYSIPGGLKNAIDWLSRTPNQPFAQKPVLIQTASPGPIGGARCQYHLRQVLVCLDALTMNKPEFMGGLISNKVNEDKHTLTDPTSREFLARQLAAFVDFIRRLSSENRTGLL